MREGRFERFQDAETEVLVCTDIMSRGMDTVRVRMNPTINTLQIRNADIWCSVLNLTNCYSLELFFYVDNNDKTSIALKFSGPRAQKHV